MVRAYKVRDKYFTPYSVCLTNLTLGAKAIYCIIFTLQNFSSKDSPEYVDEYTLKTYCIKGGTTLSEFLNAMDELDETDLLMVCARKKIGDL